MMRTVLFTVAVLLTACKSDPGKPTGEPTAAPPGAAPPAAAPAPEAPPAPPADPFAGGFCEYSIDGGEVLKGGGGLNNVQSRHWLTDEQGKKLAAPLLINCGPAGKQVNIITNDATLTLGAGKFKITKIGDGPKEFAVLAADFLSGVGEIELTAFDDQHVAGTFSFTGAGKVHAGKFDLKCPFPGNGLCK